MYRAENTNFLLVEGVLNIDEDPLNEWSWPDTFDQTTLTHDTTYDETVPVYENLVDDGSLLEKKQSLNLADETFRKFCKPDKGGGFHAAGCTARQVIRTIIIDSDGDLNVSKEVLSYPPEVVTSSPMTKSRQTSDADTMVDLASDLYDVLKVS